MQIAIRRYSYFCTDTQTEYAYEDRMVRKSRRSFVLIQSPDRPGDPEVERPYSLKQVFRWLREGPEQIERTVVMGAATVERH